MKIGILGHGVTAQSVEAYCHTHHIPVVSPEWADWVVASPGIPPAQYPELAGSIPPSRIISDIDFAWKMRADAGRPWDWVAVTGTNGKSTVSAMVAHLLGCPVGGNFGIPLSSFIDHEGSQLVVELSSYQLEITRWIKPRIMVWTNLTPDHLERHGTMEAYANAKANLLRCHPSAPLIYGEGAPWITPHLAAHEGPLHHVTADHPLYQTLQQATHLMRHQKKGHGLRGHHNGLNATMALLAAASLDDKPLPPAVTHLLDYEALPHRMEWVGDWQGIGIYNDSKSTNPDSTLVAIESFDEPVHLLMGGKDKGLELDGFLARLFESVATCYCYGDIATRIRHLVPHPPPHLHFCDTLFEATDHALAHAKPGDVVLLSPACSSFDQFKDFIDRGNQFKAHIQQKINSQTH
ncbi:UDP-N-acetylmuramoyl-L-alanine--D-glutamate ligase [bacterium]|nr:UDP-N-acetylmuramoyl-L-alanine--D-glutamate ligase [bacterium]